MTAAGTEATSAAGGTPPGAKRNSAGTEATSAAVGMPSGAKRKTPPQQLVSTWTGKGKMPEKSNDATLPSPDDETRGGWRPGSGR